MKNDLRVQASAYQSRGLPSLAQIRRALGQQQTKQAILFLLPSLVILGIFVFWPIVQSFLLGLQHWQFGSTEVTWVGLDNYPRMLADERVWGALQNTVYYTLVVVPVGLLLSLFFAI